MLLVCGGISLPPYEVQRYKKLEKKADRSISALWSLYVKSMFELPFSEIPFKSFEGVPVAL